MKPLRITERLWNGSEYILIATLNDSKVDVQTTAGGVCLTLAKTRRLATWAAKAVKELEKKGK